MVIFVKHRFCYYRRFEHDIWGLCLLDLKSSNEYLDINIFNTKIINKKKINKIINWAPKSWLLRFFYRLYTSALERKHQRLRRYIYRIDIITHLKRRRKFNKRFVSLRVARLYFLTLKDYQFRSLFRRASKLDGNLENNYCLLLECRIMAIFYRTNFLCNIFEIIQFIKAGNVFINFKKVLHINSSISNISRITCSRHTIKRLRLHLKNRLKHQIMLFNTPKFLFISYYFFFAYLCKLPKKKDFVYPFSLDIQRITGYN
jgi:ribosomal protein S4